MFEIFMGDALSVLKEIPDNFFDTCATSPPYWKKRDYKHPDQIGQEKTPAEFVIALADVFDQVKRVLKPRGSLWINIDDTFHDGVLLGIPFMLVFELKKRGWIFRGDGIWWKPNSSPESADNRLTRAHEYLFHFVKQRDYYFDMDSIREAHTNPWAIDCLRKFNDNPQPRKANLNFFSKEERYTKKQKGMTRAEMGALMNPKGKHKRDVITEERFFRLKQNLTEEQLRKVLTRLTP